MYQLHLYQPSDNRIDEIIERTAKFINSSTDPQMEIVIQAKQSNNPSFSFLNKDDPLYLYYKHVRLLLQTGLSAYGGDRKSTRLNSSHSQISYAVFCLKKKKNIYNSYLSIFITF